VAFEPMGAATDKLTDTTSGDKASDSFILSSLCLGMSLKYLIFTGGFEPFISVSPFFEPIAIDYGGQSVVGGNGVNVSGSYEGDDVGALFKAGADIHLDESLVLTPFLGYNFSSPVQFKGNATYTGVAGKDGPSQLMMEPDPKNRLIVTPQPLKDAPPPNSEPFSLDLSGFEMGLALGAFFDF
ncbi:MAG TPA: hypothetical protein VMU88_06075, partial [bacterium]|nr:hypothetical protein [bacterium]